MRQPWTLTPEMFLDEKEVTRLLRSVRQAAQHAPDTEVAGRCLDRVLIECLLFTGMRNSELCTLRVEDVKPARGSATAAIRGPRGKIDRTIHLPAALASLLRKYVSRTRPILAERAAKPAVTFIVNERGNAYDRTALYRRVVRILTDADLASRASVQLLRHTYGYLAYLRTGGNLLFVQRQLGHAHPIVTSIYAQFVPEDGGELADRVFI